MTRSDPALGRLAAAFLLAPLAAGSPAAVHAAISASIQGGDPAEGVFPLIFAGVFGWPVALGLGGPAYLLLRRWRVAVTPASGAAAGFVVTGLGGLAFLLLSLVGSSGGTRPLAELAGVLLMLAAAGALGGLAFWAILAAGSRGRADGEA